MAGGYGRLVSGYGLLVGVLSVNANANLLSLVVTRHFPATAVRTVRVSDRTTRRTSRGVTTSPFRSEVATVRASLRSCTPSLRCSAVIYGPPCFVGSLRSPSSRHAATHRASDLARSRLLTRSTRLLHGNNGLTLMLPATRKERLLTATPRCNFATARVICIRPAL